MANLEDMLEECTETEQENPLKEYDMLVEQYMKAFDYHKHLYNAADEVKLYVAQNYAKFDLGIKDD